jgi:hypothetical protein
MTGGLLRHDLHGHDRRDLLHDLLYQQKVN